MNFFILAGLAMISRFYPKPWALALIYTLFGIVWGILSTSKIDSEQIVSFLIAGVIMYVLSFAYFWLLVKFEESFLFWIILILGLIIGMI